MAFYLPQFHPIPENDEWWGPGFTVISESMDQPHLIEAMDRVLRRPGGAARVWRVDRLATVIVPGTRDVQTSFAPAAKHYAVVVEPCPPRRGNRKGSVESSVRYVSGRWWKTMTATTIEEAQRSLDRFCSQLPARPRFGAGRGPGSDGPRGDLPPARPRRHGRGALVAADGAGTGRR